MCDLVIVFIVCNGTNLFEFLAYFSGMMDEEGEQFVTYFLPSKETLEKRMLDTAEGAEFDPEYV